MPRKEDDLDMLAELFVDGGIDIGAQERRGQRRLVNNEVLPKRCNDCWRGQLEQIGIVFGEDFDDLFVNVELPEGWSKISTDHAMWSKLVDDRGRERASIFYKAAFYDRDAHINITRRFSARWEPVGGYSGESYQKPDAWYGVVKDCGKIVWQTDETVDAEPEEREQYLVWGDSRQELAEQARNWLDENYPDWQDPLAYWD